MLGISQTKILVKSDLYIINFFYWFRTAKYIHQEVTFGMLVHVAWLDLLEIQS